MHRFIGVDCSECGEFYRLRYTGETGDAPRPLTVTLNAPLIIRCPKCHHSYGVDSAHLREREQEEPPEYDFKDKI